MTEMVSSKIDIKASPADVLAVLHDVESYPTWARGVKDVTVRERDDEGRASLVEFEVQPGPLPRMRYVLRYAYEPGRLSWEYVEGDLRDLSGSYEVEGAPDAASVTYHLTIDPGKIPLPGFVKARAAREISRVALDELKRRVETS